MAVPPKGGTPAGGGVMAGARITGGVFRSLPLSVPRTIRPTEAKVRLAIFNILGDVTQDARVLDVYAGSGALGVEALSRGAAFAAFIEFDTEGVLAIRDNLARLEPDISRSAYRIVHMEAERGLRELAASELPFDVVLLDPPYQSEEGKKALNTVVECAILAPAGIAILEHHQRTDVPASFGPLRRGKRHRYGDTVLSLYQFG